MEVLVSICVCLIFYILYVRSKTCISTFKGKIIKEYEIPNEHISCITFSPDGKSLYLGSLTGNILETNLSNSNTEVYSEVDDSGMVSNILIGHVSIVR